MRVLTVYMRCTYRTRATVSEHCHIHHYPGASLCCNMVIWGVNAVNTSEYHSRPQISWTPLPLNIIRSPRSKLLSQRSDQEDGNMSPCHEGAAQSEFGHQYVCRYFTVWKANIHMFVTGLFWRVYFIHAVQDVTKSLWLEAWNKWDVILTPSFTAIRE